MTKLKKGIPNLAFWKHEWNDHGKCSGFYQHEYFQTALKLFDDVNLLEQLKESELVLSL